MIEPLISGALAGYAIAIPIGAIAILILETALKRGFRAAFAAGSGAATADLIYASLAATLGSALVVLLSPIVVVLKWASAAFLVGLGLWGLARLVRGREPAGGRSRLEGPSNLGKTYFTVLGLTLLNPATVAYFAALIIGFGAAGLQNGGKIAFVIGAFLASWSWQTLLAATGALMHKHLRADIQNLTSLVGNLMIVGFGVRIVI